MYVYNVDDDCCREVTIKPNTKWGGDGSLGCGIGYGYLHRIPVRELPPESKPLFRMPVNVSQVGQGATATTPAVSSPQNASTTPLLSGVPAEQPTMAYVPPLLNTFPAVSAGSDNVAPADVVSAPGIYGVPPMPPTTILSPSSMGGGAPLTSTTTNSNPGIFGVPPMPPTSMFNPMAAPPATVSETKTFDDMQSQFTSTLPPPIWALPSSVGPIQPAVEASPAPVSTSAPTPTPTQEALAAAFAPTPMTYGAYGQAFTQAYVPVPMSESQQQQQTLATVQQTPMSIPTYASCPQTVVPPNSQSPFSGAQQQAAAPVPMMSTGMMFQQSPMNVMSPPGTTMNTNISLPGMPPLTVSATIPPQQLEGLQFNRQ